MQWTAIVVETTSEVVEAVSYLLTEAGANGIQVEDAADYAQLKPGKYGPYGEIVDPESLKHRQSGAAITGYFPPNQFGPELIDEIKTRVAKLNEFGLNPGSFKVTFAPVDETDWATEWQKYYHPVRVTHELTIVPQWETYQAHDSEKIIFMDPGMAFGTGTHPTTQLMLQALEISLRGGERMIDVGTGSGILSIAAKLLGAGDVRAYDIDQIAVDSARRNIELNPQAQGITFGVNSLLGGIHTQVDLIVANILVEIIVPLVPQAFENLTPGGKFLTSGIISDKFELCRDTMIKQGFKIDQTLRMKDWYGIIAHKPAEDED